MNIDQLRYFIEVAKSGHMTHASENLNISQPALSSAIAKLESELDIDLFERVGRGIILSEAGQVFLPYVQSSIDTLDNGLSALAKSVDEERKSIVLQTLPLTLFPDLVGELFKICPEITIMRAANNPTDLADNLLHKKTDICVSQQILPHADLNWSELYKDSICLVTSYDHKFSKHDSIHISDLKEEKFITANEFSGLTRYHLRISQMLKTNLAISHTVNVPNEAMPYIENNLGVGIMSESVYNDMVAHNYSGIKKIQLLDNDDVPLLINCCIYWRKKYNSPETIAIKNKIISFFKQYPKK